MHETAIKVKKLRLRQANKGTCVFQNRTGKLKKVSQNKQGFVPFNWSEFDNFKFLLRTENSVGGFG